MPTEIEELARALVRARRFDEVAMALQRQRAIDTYGQALGQEVGQVGVTFDLRPDDMVFPSYRQPGVALMRGISPIEMLRFYAGTTFMPWDWRKHRFFAYTIPVGSQTAHATGFAWAARRRGEDYVTLVFFGDGAASQGEVHEAMNYAGVFQAPIVFVCENNGWAISMPSSRQTAAEGIYKRAAGYGFEGVRVSADDLWEVRRAARKAVDKARAGGGPSLVEIVSYRLGYHTTSDDATRYRSQEEVEQHRSRDPLARFIDEARREHGLEEAALERISAEVEAEFDAVAEQFIAEREAQQ